MSRRVPAGLLILFCAALLAGCVMRREPRLYSAVETAWDQPQDWSLTRNDLSEGTLRAVQAPIGEGLQLDYVLGGDHGWVQMRRTLEAPLPTNTPLTFLLKAIGQGDFEVKFIDADGSIFGTKLALGEDLGRWQRVTVYLDDLHYWWGGDGTLDGVAYVDLAVSSKGGGTVWLDDIGLGRPGMVSSFIRNKKPTEAQQQAKGLCRIPWEGPDIAPDADLPGVGFAQRRAAGLAPEDPLVLEWLKAVQDVSSPGRRMLPTGEDNQCQTFNNALVAMAFLVKGEKERAERILDFFAEATDRNNMDPTLQNFFYRGEARGFFQHCELNPTENTRALHHGGDADRWVGDMAWLLFAYKYYERQYGPERYRRVVDLLHRLLVSWYKDTPEVPGGGYVQHGWRKGDAKLHESFGHAEGNIDCYAAFLLLGEKELAGRVRRWIEAVTQGNSQPLDVYTWRVLAYGGEMGHLLDIPDRDLRYRKTLTVNGKPVTGVYHSAAPEINNIWLDGVGHMACALFAAGNVERGSFYANQLDAFLFDRNINGAHTRALPYTANEQGGFEWCPKDRGIVSVAAWYIFAKNGFNPMTLESAF